MNRLTTLLQSSYPVSYQRWKAVWIPALIVFFILYFLQPFGISQIDEGQKLGMALGNTLISAAASILFNYLLPLLFPSYYKEQNWTLGKHVLSLLGLLVTIAVGVWAYLSWQMQVWLGGREFFLVLSWVLILAVFPCVFFSLWNRNLQLARNLKEATELNACLSGRMAAEKDKTEKDGEESPVSEAEEMPVPLLTFAGGTREVLQLEATAFRYAESEGNYVKVTYLSKETEKCLRKTLRATMKQAEAAVAEAPYIVRCHRAFLVNVRAVRKVDGNSQGYRLQLEGCDEEIPVSRAYAKEVRRLIL